MRAIVITETGGPEVLQVQRRPVPAPGEGEVLVRVEAAGVNRPDVLQRLGRHPVPPGVPKDIPGLDIAGEVVALGSNVQGISVGDRICALTGGAGYAEYCVAPAPQCLPIPNGIDAIGAASLPEVFFTVWSNVFDRGRLAEGEKFLVHGGTSGIGVAAIQMAAGLGAQAYATAGSTEKCRACEELGAEKAFNYKEVDFVEAAREATGGYGMDVILDMVGGEYMQKNIKLLHEDGRLVYIAFIGGAKAEVSIPDIQAKRLWITGSQLRLRPIDFKAGIAENLRTRIWPLLDDGRIKPVIDSTFPLAEAGKAHELMQSNQHIGKIVLTVA
ncbi:MAG: NAD(P)H-quinone oxidoreductase [Acetobacterales bacterium]